MENEAIDYLLPATWNAIQSALYQLERNNPELAKQFLSSAQRTLGRVIHPS
uniref:Uncharacterized protein n=1 Tax=Cyanothece sp. (strain PCC 7425 / ATCC 29141) TaxID=395961 RepID=B8HMY5_CYAP4